MLAFLLSGGVWWLAFLFSEKGYKLIGMVKKKERKKV